MLNQKWELIMFRDLCYRLKQKEVRMGILLFLMFALGVVNLFVSMIEINTIMLMLLGWGMLEACVALRASKHPK